MAEAFYCKKAARRQVFYRKFLSMFLKNFLLYKIALFSFQKSPLFFKCIYLYLVLMRNFLQNYLQHQIQQHHHQLNHHHQNLQPV